MMAENPLKRLERALEVAGQRPTLWVEQVESTDAIAALRELIGRGDALLDTPAISELRARVDEARQLPEPSHWTAGEGDPLERLRGLWRDAPSTPELSGADDVTGSQSAQASSPAAPPPQPPSASTALGEQVFRELAARPLPGALRARAASELAAYLNAASGPEPELRGILNLLIFER